MFDRLDETIVAISSPPGCGIRGIVRLSGPLAFDCAASVFISDHGIDLLKAGGHERHMGRVRLTADAWLPAEAYTFRAPASYTRQDLVELHVPGSPPVLAMLLDQLLQAGARPAEPGEFTARAFYAGAIDLTGVEAVAAVIHAQTDAQLRASERLLHGALSRRTRGLREELADLLALIEAEIDFVEEPIEFVAPAQVLETVSRVADQLARLLNDSESVERLEVLPRIALVGLPNAGKSTLFNRLTGMDRAIQSSVAGTTRDVITAPLTLPGGEVIVCDTAGFIQASGNVHSGDDHPQLTAAIESITARAMADAELILVVIDATDAPARVLSEISDRLAGRRYDVVLNKTDALREPLPVIAGHQPVYVSAATGAGLDELRVRMSEILFKHAEKHGSELISLTQRHRDALQEAREALLRAASLFESSTDHSVPPAELLALEIRHAMHALSLLLGEVTTEDLLGRIFSRFCIGK